MFFFFFLEKIFKFKANKDANFLTLFCLVSVSNTVGAIDLKESNKLTLA